MNRRELIGYCVRAGISIGFGGLATFAASNGKLPKALAHTSADRSVTPIRNDGKLYPEFKGLLNKHSDRVLFGLDTPWMQCWEEEPFKQWVQWADKVVAQLEYSGAAERIMHKNAEKLFNISYQ